MIRMRTTYYFIAFALLVLGQSPLRAQTGSRQITGIVSEAQTSTGLPGVNVVIKGTALGTATDANGSFALQLPAGNVTLVFSAIGYTAQEVNVGQQNNLVVKLQNDVQQLSEIVVVGYGEQTRKTLTGSVASVGSDAIRDIPVASADQLLQGKATGVQITANSGVPGGGIFIRVRGTNSVNANNDPLYVVDGVFINNTNLITNGMGNQVPSNPLADLNPADIESIQILKDANATAIYGSRGANGVVLITTKRGKLNSKSRISFGTYQGWSQATKVYEVASGPEIAELENERFLNDGGNPANAPFPNPADEPTYDRITDLFRTARTSSYDLSLAGGDANTTYYLGLSYFDQESIVRPSKFRRYSGRLNLDHTFSSAVKAGTSTTLASTFRNVSSNDNNPAGVINSALFPRTNLPVLNADGTYAKYGNFDNHLALIRENQNKADGLRVISNIYAEFTLLPDLKLRSSWSVDFNDMYENNYRNTQLLAGQPRGTAASVLSRDITLLNEQVLSYQRRFGGVHDLNALVGNTLQRNTFLRTTLNGQQFPSNDFQTIASSATQTGTSTRSEARLASFFGKVNYTLLDRYSLEGSFRADASSRFGVNNRWGYFPSAGAAWRVSQEPFFEPLRAVVNELKLRGSVGLTGNQSGINDFASLGLWEAGNNYLDLPGTVPSQLANPDLSWESTRQWNVGLDAAFFNNRLAVELNYYNKYTYDLLLNVPVPRKLGYSSIVENFGAVSNRGFELVIHATHFQRDDFTWTTDLNLSRNVNNIERLAAPITTGSRDIFRLQEGAPLYSFWLYRQLAVNAETGDAEYEDLNGDGRITVDDRQLVGNAWPDYQGGLTNTLRYKNFDLSAFLYFERGAKIMNMNRYFLVHGGTQRNIGYFREQLERWQQPGDQTDIPRLTTNPSSNNYGGVVQSLSSRYLEDGSFLRLRTLTLGYNLSQDLIRRAKLASLRLYVSATNLFTATPYSGLDPEVNSQSNVANTKNFDWATVPQPRTWQVGLNASF